MLIWWRSFVYFPGTPDFMSEFVTTEVIFQADRYTRLPISWGTCFLSLCLLYKLNKNLINNEKILIFNFLSPKLQSFSISVLLKFRTSCKTTFFNINKTTNYKMLKNHSLKPKIQKILKSIKYKMVTLNSLFHFRSIFPRKRSFSTKRNPNIQATRVIWHSPNFFLCSIGWTNNFSFLFHQKYHLWK